jgi:urea transporter
MSKSNGPDPPAAMPPAGIPVPVLATFRGIGQIMFQENALTGLLFVIGIVAGSPPQAVGIVVGAIIGTATAYLLGFDPKQRDAGIYGFNPALVGIAALFFFQPGAASLTLLVVGCVVATVLTYAMRTFLPFPTYTTPFIVTTWVIILSGRAMGAVPNDPGFSTLIPDPPLPFTAEAVSHGVAQVMFQGSLWTGLVFLVAIAINDRFHAGWVLAASVLGMAVASYHVTAGANAIDPDWLIPRTQLELVRLGLFGFNATLVAIALFLWRPSLIAPLVGIVLTVPLTELVPLAGVPALTAPFVLATWIVLALGYAEGLLLKPKQEKT